MNNATETKKNLKRFKDRADAVFITGLISMTFLLACMGITLDLAKNTKLKIDQDSQAQQSTQVAVKSLNERGSLDKRSVNAMVNEFMAQSGVSYYENALIGAGEFQDETAAFRAPRCQVRDITLADGSVVTGADLPYIIIKLDENRAFGTGAGTVTYLSKSGAEPQLVSGELDPYVDYRVISAEVHGSVNNTMMDMFGVPCQNLRSSVSAIAFGSNEDLKKK